MWVINHGATLRTIQSCYFNIEGLYIEEKGCDNEHFLYIRPRVSMLVFKIDLAYKLAAFSNEAPCDILLLIITESIRDASNIARIDEVIGSALSRYNDSRRTL